MDKQDFKFFCHTQFIRWGFQKHKSMYFRKGQDGILCGLWLKKSNYSSSYVIMYHYYLGDFESRTNYPTYADYDLVGYIQVMSKETVRGKHFLTGSIDYERYSQEELLPYMNTAFEEYILPPIQNDRTYLLTHNDHLTSHHTKEKSAILDLLRN